MSLQTGAPAPAVEVDAASQQLARGVKGGANWYFYIGALSLINSVLLLIGDESTFLVGLGITQVVDVLIQLLRPELSQSLGMVLVALGFVINLVIIGMFVAFGFLARAGRGWAFLVGMALYLFDGILVLVFGDLLAAGFHLFALVMLGLGYRALRAQQAAG
jgi:multisubunit Na+/H+ antiporter MnhG subunit